MELNQAIKNFLNYHDTLFLGDFGAFITRYEPANLNENNNTIYPPYKSIGFNEKLQKEDNSFAEFLSTEYSITISEAKEKIDSFIKQCKENLSQKQIYIIPNLGKFYHEKDGSLHFEMLPEAAIKTESFGMQPIKIKKITKPKPNLTMTEKQKSSSLKWVIIIIIILLPFIGIGAWYFIHPVSFKNVLSSIGIIKKDVPTKPVAEVPIKKDTTTVTETITPPTTDTNTETQPSSGNFHVVGGSFQEKANADRYLTTLQNKGYQAEMFNYGNWYIVSYGSFATKNEAQRLLNKIAATENPDAWILKR